MYTFDEYIYKAQNTIRGTSLSARANVKRCSGQLLLDDLHIID